MSPAHRSELTDGFTLVEVLIALLLAVILISVTASTLGVTLRAEQSLDLQDAGERLINTLQTDVYLNNNASNTTQRYADQWLITTTPLETGPATNRIAWEIWELTARERPSVQWRFATRSH